MPASPQHPFEHKRSNVPLTRGARLIAEERYRQITEEGYEPADDHGQWADLARAAAAYALWAGDKPDMAVAIWPWAVDAFKPAGRKRNLEKAGALASAALDAMLAPAEAPDAR